MKSIFLVWYLVSALLVVIAQPALATKIVHMNPEKLAETASVVVRGTVVGSHSFWNANRSKIFTETILMVDEAFKGQPGNEVRLLQLGGEVDGVKVTVHGALLWNQGEEVVVFLEPYQGDSFHVAGFSQGKFLVERDPVTGRPFINRPALAGVEIVDDHGHQHSEDTENSRVPLERFLSQALGSDYKPANR